MAVNNLINDIPPTLEYFLASFLFQGYCIAFYTLNVRFIVLFGRRVGSLDILLCLNSFFKLTIQLFLRPFEGKQCAFCILVLLPSLIKHESILL